MPHVGASRAGKNFAVGPLIVANELKILKEQFVLWCGLFFFWSHHNAKGGFQVRSSGNTGPTSEQQSVDVLHEAA